jgi:hypothetical protein
MTHIIFQIDKLQVMRRDKSKFQFNLMTKDIKLLPKDRREDILNSNSYLDVDQSDGKFVLIIDPNIPKRHSE